MRLPSLALLGAVVLAALTPSAARAADPLPLPPAGSISWERCKGKPPRSLLECGTLTVPLNYAEPGGTTIDLAVIRSAAPKAHRLGAILMNPGGPGGSGLDLLTGIVLDSAYRRLNRRFDLVSFDPRGVGKSAAAKCEPGASTDLFASVDDRVIPLADMTDALGPYILGCQEATGSLLPYLGTADVARDMDQLREAVGDPKLNYVGYSYGGFLGATYAAMFPSHVGRMVLDGVDDPEEYANQPLLSDLHQAQANQRELLRFLAFVQREAHPRHGGAVKGYRRAIARLARKPARVLGVHGVGVLHADDARAVVGELIASKSYWPYLALAVKDMIAGQWRTMATFAGVLDEDGDIEDTTAGYLANAGADRALSVDLITPDYVAKQRAAAPDFPNDSWTASLAVAMWPHTAKRFAGPWTYDAPAGAPPILVIGTRFDPRTPYPGAPALTKRLGHASLLSFEGDGHTAFDNGENGRCIDNKVITYLVRGKAPRSGTTCHTQAPQHILRR